ncbi:TPA: helix-turn-helix domain-containing protein [Candidatus Berkelbacteria bacterium]|uniref:Heat shock protein Hsp20, HSP20 family protein n=1 Tax=Berkelbacteria bacterium GW2011_GWE1_39_12 TaxID=1618337 RepID=A0A0G4B563_9BACT|nr:MAG: heat shock protein Hsp20, HSP20 family protein [Berkelbacteria bacterium GW2011_GWE1_39_12]HBO60358.1 helix-turn-helix domain-containing protein [Candidatus Berkelbacteria bacterium]
MKIEIHRVSKQLKILREQKQLTQEELAKSLGVSRQSIIALEQGKSLPSLPLAVAFSEIFETPFEAIFCIEEKINSHINFNDHEEVRNFMSNDLSPWSPMREASHLHEVIDRLFDENWPQVKSPQLPTMNVYEKDTNVVVAADVPGIKEEDLSIEVGEDTLTISGERKTEEEVNEEDFYRKEVSTGSFSRTVQLPAIVDKEKAEAEIKDGQLIVTLPKKAAVSPKITKIKVKKA